MLLVIDVGNTNMVLGVYKEEKLIAKWRLITAGIGTADETGIAIVSLFEHNNLNYEDIDGVIISSVVPDIMYSLKHGIMKYFNIQPMVIGPGIKTGINIKTDNPKEVGADLLVNSVAAKEIYGGNVIIVDYGTATKFNIIFENGEFPGVIICPGIRICAEALYQKAAQLPRVEIKMPNCVIGKNTVDSMQAGMIYSAIGETEYIINKIKGEYSDIEFKVIATGGLGRTISEYTKIIDEYSANLTLEGLRIIYNKNK